MYSDIFAISGKYNMVYYKKEVP